MVMAGDAPARGRAAGHDDDIAAMVWRRRGQTMTYVDRRLRCNPDVGVWVARALRRCSPFAVLYMVDVRVVGVIARRC
jgi:hypothetical protein